jgi:hypothetical protein
MIMSRMRILYLRRVVRGVHMCSLVSGFKFFKFNFLCHHPGRAVQVCSKYGLI